MWSSLGKTIMKDIVGQLKLEEWSNQVLDEVRLVFRIRVIGRLEERVYIVKHE